MFSSGISRPEARSRAARSRGVKMELLVSTRKRLDVSTQRWMSSAAPGMAWFSWTSTPSMSVSQHSISWPLRYTDADERTCPCSALVCLLSAMVPSAGNVPPAESQSSVEG